MKIRCAEFLKSILAGIIISIGGMVFVSSENKYVGALLFCVGLITVVVLKMNLYTGRIGYILNNDKMYFIDTLLSIAGNFVGCLICGTIKSPMGNVISITEAKLAKTLPDAFIDAIFCGILIYVCVEIFKKRNTLIGIFLCIPTFILCGFEHSVANMFYFSNAKVFTAQAAVFILIVILGNAVGGLLIPIIDKLTLFFQKEYTDKVG